MAEKKQKNTIDPVRAWGAMEQPTDLRLLGVLDGRDLPLCISV